MYLFIYLSLQGRGTTSHDIIIDEPSHKLLSVNIANIYKFYSNTLQITICLCPIDENIILATDN